MTEAPSRSFAAAWLLRRKPSRAAVGVMVAAVAVSSCAVHGLSFRTDERVKILTPEENEELALPFNVAWTVEDFDGLLLVLFDRSPMRPNQGLRALVPEDDPCRREPNCPDADWLAQRHIYLIEGTNMRVDQLPDRREGDRGKDRHDVTIVLVGRDGERQGESAWTREFIVKRER